MQIIRFESIIEGNLIRIPEEYVNQIPARVAVTLVDVEKPKFRPKIKKELPGIEEFQPVLDTKGWKFDREEANERR
ncbi:MAG: hypothetical protein LBV07_03380 [Syntrophobacterales bacterium]|nr:hypothetical protein [Syntrophobacterales bacterium]